MSMHAYLLAAHVEGPPGNAVILLAAPIQELDLDQVWAQRMETREFVAWDLDRQAVRAQTQTWFGRILIRQTPLTDPNPETVQQALIQGIEQTGLSALPWTRKLMQLRHRVCFLREKAGLDHLPDLSDTGLTKTLAFWLGPFLAGVRSIRDLNRVDLTGAMAALFFHEDRRQVEALAPSHVTVPSGSRISLSYTDGNRILTSPILAVRIQEMFGETRTPAVAGGRIPVTLHLLSPAGRPVQVTKDLENFWRNTYRDVKKDLMGRYPRHFWPDDPLTAIPTGRTKPRSPKR